MGWPLEMETAEDAVDGTRFVVLYKLGFADLLFKLPLRERFEKIAPLIAKYLRLENNNTLDRCRGDFYHVVSISLKRYCPYSFFFIGSASIRSLSSSIQPLRRAISSRQAIFSPCRFSSTSIKVEASDNEPKVPVSSQAKPRPKSCTFSCRSSRKCWFTVVISNSPRA